MAARVLTVVGYSGCGYFIRAGDAAKALSAKHPEWNASVIEMSRPEYQSWLAPIASKHGIRHTSSPICFIGTPEDGQVIGGCDATIAWLAKEYPDVQGRASCY